MEKTEQAIEAQLSMCKASSSSTKVRLSQCHST